MLGVRRLRAEGCKFCTADRLVQKGSAPQNIPFSAKIPQDFLGDAYRKDKGRVLFWDGVG